MQKDIEKVALNNSLIIKGVVLVIISVMLGVFSYKFFWEEEIPENSRLSNLEKSLQDIRASMNVDSVRQFNIQKIMKIISKYNNDMPSSLKYEIADEIYNMSVKYTNMDVDLLCAIITLESGGKWDPEVVSEAGAMGLMQIMPTTGIWLAHYEGITWTSPEEILFDPIYNIRIGARYLSALMEMYDLEGGLAAYHGGEKRAAIWLANDKAEGILYTDTSNYIPYVLKLYDDFKGLSL
ncbi:MAG: lytic transglycosylase domain-containing protein [bacterium]